METWLCASLLFNAKTFSHLNKETYFDWCQSITDLLSYKWNNFKHVMPNLPRSPALLCGSICTGYNAYFCYVNQKQSQITILDSA